MAKKSYLSKEGYNKMIDEFERLMKKRPALSEEIARAREHGDLKENAEYHAAKESLTNLQRRINELEIKIRSSEIIDSSKMEKDKVYIGATVTLRDLSDGDEFSYMIVDSEEADPSEGKISVDSPVAKGLLGHKAGEEVVITLPAGVQSYKILKIERK